ncbi:MAG: LON peptidase substrate-binding domain-containing protein [Chromatiales bacterium]|nr:LON peptidase substrate-binding domain-containing protein [Chromatiales bacterium]
MSQKIARLPLFPLGTVLFPGGPLPLRVFEPRYLDMISRCLKQDGEFGVVLIRAGSETGEVQVAGTGTLARVLDWYQGSDGILGITALGGRRFQVGALDRQVDGLYLADVELLEDEPREPLPAEFRPMASLLQSVLDDLGKLYQMVDRDLEDAGWVGCRFAEILPMPAADKQRCLEVSDPLERLRFLQPLLQSLRSRRPQ